MTSNWRFAEVVSNDSGLEGAHIGAAAASRLHRPVFLNPTQIQMPVGALTSISHRASSAVLAASVPAATYLFSLSLRDEAGFDPATASLGRFAFKAAAIIAV